MDEEGRTEAGRHAGSERQPPATGSVSPLRDALAEIESQFAVISGRAELVETALAVVERSLDDGEAGATDACLDPLLPLLSRNLGPLARVLFEFLERRLSRTARPAPLVLGMLDSRDTDLRLRAVELAVTLVRQDRLGADRTLAISLSRALGGQEDSTLAPGLLGRVGEVLDRLPAPPGRNPLEELLLDDSNALRILAARALDAADRGLTEDVVVRVIGARPARSLMPYLEFTRATHQDLVAITPVPGHAPPLARALKEAERTLDRKMLGQVIGRLGWPRVSWGLEVHRVTGVRIGQGFPLVLSWPESRLLGEMPGLERLWDRYLIVAHGSRERADGGGTADADTVQRFRRYNLAHAALLGYIIDPVPLTVSRVRRILGLTDEVVTGYQALFRGHADDAAGVDDLYRRLRSSITADLGPGGGEGSVPADVRRRVQMFEDPRTIDDVHTLHGLKRYLHQSGLRHAFRLFRSSDVANRTVDVVLTSNRLVLDVVQSIRYIDFEPDLDSGSTRLPFAVELAVDMVMRQIVHRRTRLPAIEILGYGNEVQVFVSFLNHPAFLRIDFSPPLNGGMIDLEYFAVSQYEMDHHPDLGLHGIRMFLERLDFDVHADGFRLHARYDKERAIDLADILEKAAALFRLVPYLMDVDWALGSLDYPEPVRRAVGRAWNDFMMRWGVLPIEELVTRDRRRVVRKQIPGPGGTQEVPWDGRDEYVDRFSSPDTAGLRERVGERLRMLGLDRLAAGVEEATGEPAQLSWERLISRPLEEAMVRGEIVDSPDGPKPAAPGAVRVSHEALELAGLLVHGGVPAIEARNVASLVRSIERHLRFEVTGSVDGYPVGRAELSLRVGRIGVFVLRDGEGVPRLALATAGAALLRAGGDGSAVTRGHLSFGELTRLLRDSNYLLEGELSGEPETPALRLPDAFDVVNPHAPFRPQPGDRVVLSTSAAPGRATGFVRFGLPGRTPEDYRGSVLVVPALRPEDAPLLRQAVAVVSTGGGALSHAGLMALELRKPALIVSGRWESGRDGTIRLVLRRSEFREEETRIGDRAVVLRHDIREREEVLSEGDLVVADADTGLLIVLGQTPDTLALHEELHQFRWAEDRLAGASAAGDILALRGSLLRAAHHLERILTRLVSPVLARHATGELLLVGADAPTALDREGRGRLMRILIASPVCGEVAREAAARIVDGLCRRLALIRRDAPTAIASSDSPFDVVFTRLSACRIGDALACAGVALGHDPVLNSGLDLDGTVRARLDDLRRDALAGLRGRSTLADDTGRLRHVVDRIENLSVVLGPCIDPGERALLDATRAELEEATARRLSRLSTRPVLDANDGGLELAPLIGAKAANLGELARLLDPERIPDWFAVTDRAFREVLAGPVGPAADALGIERSAHRSLDDAIAVVLSRSRMSDRAKSEAIRLLWQAAPVPRELSRTVQAAYQKLGGARDGGPEDGGVSGSAAVADDREAPFVAIRSSAREEDTEASAWAGQFDTYLFVRGGSGVLEHLKKAWAGLWTERAIDQRRLAGTNTPGTGGGVIVQRMVPSRVSGVLSTVRVAGDRPREMLINVGWGLGEGIVSGALDADEILIPRSGDPNARIRDLRYRVADKRARIVFDVRAGVGTRREDVVFHHRRQPALDHSEILELVRDASCLESVYGYPLDIEFAYEGSDLRILQVRPIAIFQIVLGESQARYPLKQTGAGQEGVS